MDYLSALKTFVRVAELGSLTRAALDLGIKTSTASRHIAELEADLRIALFNRSTRGVSLTEAGRTFYPHTLKVIAALGEAREAASSLNLSPSGLLRVTLPNAFGRKHIMPHIPAFIKRYPDIDLDMIFSDDIMNLIEARIDLGIRIGTLEDSSLMARKLGPHRRVACASPDYIEKFGLPATPNALALHQCILFSRLGGNAWYATRHGVGYDDPLKVSVSGRFTSNESEAMLEAALGSLGIALLPSWLAYTHLATGSLINVLPDWHVGFAPDEPSIWGVYPRKKTVSSKVRTFLDYIVLKIGEPPYWEKSSASIL